MEKENYHHGDLKEQLILNGLKLLNEQGVNGFSLRKVSAMCNVSHTAPYKHFKNKEELILAISSYVEDSFNETLGDIVEHIKSPVEQTVALGKAYVSFMVENPDYLKFLFLNDNIYTIEVKENIIGNTDSRAFNIFKESATNMLKEFKIPEEKLTMDIIAMWTMVHGIAVLLANGTISYDGNYLDLVQKLLCEKLSF